jgi:hypothetical protein
MKHIFHFLLGGMKIFHNVALFGPFPKNNLLWETRPSTLDRIPKNKQQRGGFPKKITNEKRFRETAAVLRNLFGRPLAKTGGV